MKYVVQIIPEDEGGYSVLVPGLPGCVSQGETREEALDNIREAISLYLEAVNESVEGQEFETVTVEAKIA
jgi:predicted RNase H-like HicB family nuclease